MDFEASAQFNDEYVAQLLAQFNSTGSTADSQPPAQEAQNDALPEYALAQQALASHALFENENDRVENPTAPDSHQETFPEHSVTENTATMEAPQVENPGGSATAEPETNDHAPEKVQIPQIELPVISDSSEYEFLPGHFEVRRVISETDPVNEIYKVKLRSGEVETVCTLPLPYSHFNLDFF